ncbi:hypothetical protein EBZ35_07685 [bacterium]|nr:hypothetical protein [bacterium]
MEGEPQPPRVAEAGPKDKGEWVAIPRPRDHSLTPYDDPLAMIHDVIGGRVRGPGQGLRRKWAILA